jgi:hypothetical protein
VISDSVVRQIVENVSDVTEDVVRRVFASYDALLEGAAVGTVVKDPETGAVAVRVAGDGVPRWQVTTVSGDSWVDMQPTLDGWETIGG